MPREVFVAGQVLTAAELNVVSDQSVMVFADSSARTAAISSPSEGMVTYLEDTNGVEVYNGSAFTSVGQSTILQVLSATKTDTFSTTSTTFADVTDLTLTLTPAATSSKVLVSFSINLGLPNTAGVQVRLMRDSTPIAVGDAGLASQKQSTTHTYPGVNTDTRNRSMQFLDSPNTTSATVYKLQIITNTSTVYVNRSSSDNNTAYGGRTASTITAMEVAG